MWIPEVEKNGELKVTFQKFYKKHVPVAGEKNFGHILECWVVCSLCNKEKLSSLWNGTTFNFSNNAIKSHF